MAPSQPRVCDDVSRRTIGMKTRDENAGSAKLKRCARILGMQNQLNRKLTESGCEFEVVCQLRHALCALRCKHVLSGALGHRRETSYSWQLFDVAESRPVLVPGAWVDEFLLRLRSREEACRA